ncbi:MAG: hypothetical protein QOF06_1235 [Solirubrobacterales bacterium]|nr:hypothetical protein [Solirubrobacterales bacterium]
MPADLKSIGDHMQRTAGDVASLNTRADSRELGGLKSEEQITSPGPYFDLIGRDVFVFAGGKEDALPLFDQFAVIAAELTNPKKALATPFGAVGGGAVVVEDAVTKPVAMEINEPKLSDEDPIIE